MSHPIALFGVHGGTPHLPLSKQTSDSLQQSALESQRAPETAHATHTNGPLSPCSVQTLPEQHDLPSPPQSPPVRTHWGGGGDCGAGVGVGGGGVEVGVGVSVGGGVAVGCACVEFGVGRGGTGVRVGNGVGSGGRQPSAITLAGEPVQVWLEKSMPTFVTRMRSPLQKFPTLSKFRYGAEGSPESQTALPLLSKQKKRFSVSPGVSSSISTSNWQSERTGAQVPAKPPLECSVARQASTPSTAAPHELCAIAWLNHDLEIHEVLEAIRSRGSAVPWAEAAGRFCTSTTLPSTWTAD